jgi:hypothetical protein
MMPLLKRCSRPPLLRENVLIPLALLDWGELTEASSRNLAVGRWEVHRAIMAEVHPVVGPTADEQRVDRVVRRLGAAVPVEGSTMLRKSVTIVSYIQRQW